MTRRLTTITAMVSWCLALAAAVRAQPPVSSALIGPLAEHYIDGQAGLALSDALERALDADPSLRAFRAERDAAVALHAQAGRRPNPTLSFEHRDEPSGSDYQTMVAVQWPLDLFRRAARVDVRAREVEVSEHVLADGQRTLAAEVRLRYGQAAAAVRAVAVTDDVVAALRRQFELITRQVSEGAVRPLDRDVLDIELRRVAAERLVAAGRADAALFALGRTIGIAAETPLVLRDSLDALVAADVVVHPKAEDAAAARLPDLLVAARPDVLEAGARVRVAEARIDQARSAGRLDVSLLGGYMRMATGFAQRGVTDQGALERIHGQFNYLSAGAVVTMPLADSHQGEVAAARAERVVAVARVDAARLSARNEMAAAVAMDVRARQALEVIEGSVSLSRHNLDVVRQTYELGQATVPEVLVEQRRHLDVERAHTDMLREVFEARTALWLARGARP